MIYIGIDPAFRKDGFGCCIIDSEKTVAFPVFRSFLDFIKWVTDEDTHREPAFVCIENSNLQDATYYTHRHPRTKALLSPWQAKGVFGAVPLKAMEVAKMSRSVGKNQAVSECTVELCRWAFGADRVHEVSPRQKGAKKPAAIVARIAKQEGHTFSKKTTNQDERDAYALALIAKQKARIRKTA